MSSSIIDAIASGSSSMDIAQDIKDILFAKSAERIDDYRQVASSKLFDSSDSNTEVETEE